MMTKHEGSKPCNEAPKPGGTEDAKKQALAYYSANGVPKKMEEILNSMFYDKPDDVFGHLADYFEKLAKPPTISKVCAKLCMDCKGQSTILTELHCTYKNKVKVLATFMAQNANLDGLKAEEREAAEADRPKLMEAAMDLINTTFNERLVGQTIKSQTEIDTLIQEIFQKMQAEEDERKAAENAEQLAADALAGITPGNDSSQSVKAKLASESKGKIKKGGKAPSTPIPPDEPAEVFQLGSAAGSVISQLMCCAGATVANVPLYQHIAMCRYCEVPSKMRLPLPMVTIMVAGKGFPGKFLAVKEYMVVPRPGMPLKQSVKHIGAIYNHCAKALATTGKGSSRMTSDTGSLCPTFDKIEAGLDLLQEAITQQGLVPGKDFHLAVNCAGPELFDADKGKYELIGGAQKTIEEVVKYWADIVPRYPALIALIDPLRKQEKQSWMRLCEAVSSSCYMVGDYAYHRPGRLLTEEFLPDDFRTSAIVLQLEQITTVTDLLLCAKKMEAVCNQIIIGCGVNESTETLMADLAVGCNARFIKVGGLCRGERSSKLTRLLAIESQLEAEGRLVHWGDHAFPFLRDPESKADDKSRGKSAGSKRSQSPLTPRPSQTKK